MNVTATVYIDSSNNTVEDLKHMLDSIPADATYAIRSYGGDRSWETGKSTITFNWEV